MNVQLDTLPSGVTRVRHPLKRRQLTVKQVLRVSPALVRVTLSGEDLHDFVSLGFDDHVKVFLPGADPAVPVMRDYTPVRHGRATCELDLEFVLHDSGPASDWAAQATPGQTLVVGGPKGSMLLPQDLQWLLLMGDATALPAMTRYLAEWPTGRSGQLAVLMPSVAERRALPLPPGVTMQWLNHEAECREFAQKWSPPVGRGYVWCAGEAREVAAWREIFSAKAGVDPERIKASAYWRQGQ